MLIMYLFVYVQDVDNRAMQRTPHLNLEKKFYIFVGREFKSPLSNIFVICDLCKM